MKNEIKIETVCVFLFFRNYRKSNGIIGFEIFKIIGIFQREAQRRSLSFKMLFYALLVSLSPLEILNSIISWIWYLLVSLSLKTPILLLREIRALKSSQKHYYPETLTSLLFCYLPLIIQASIEILSISWIAIGAPRAIFDELFLKHVQSNQLQTISPCGRKVVAWSDEIDGEILRKISCLTGATETEILLTATVNSLKEYFKALELEIPSEVLATARFVSQRALFVKNQEARGILCLALPTKTRLFEDDLVEILQVTKLLIDSCKKFYPILTPKPATFVTCWAVKK